MLVARPAFAIFRLFFLLCRDIAAATGVINLSVIGCFSLFAYSCSSIDVRSGASVVTAPGGTVALSTLLIDHSSHPHSMDAVQTARFRKAVVVPCSLTDRLSKNACLDNKKLFLRKSVSGKTAIYLFPGYHHCARRARFITRSVYATGLYYTDNRV